MPFEDVNISLIIFGLISVGLLIYLNLKFRITGRDSKYDQEDLQGSTFSKEEYLNIVYDPETLSRLSEDEKDRLFHKYKEKIDKHKKQSKRKSLPLKILDEIKKGTPFIILGFLIASIFSLIF